MADDPLRGYHPSPKQEAFINCMLGGQKAEAWLIAANRSGKSDAGAYIGATLARYGNDNARWVRAKGSNISVRDRSTSGWVSALDFPTSRDVIQPKYFDNGFVPPGASHEPLIPQREIADWRAQDQVLKLKNGSIIGFKSADSGRKKYQGAEKNWIHFDEEHPEDIYVEATLRIGADPLRIFGTITLLPPEGQVGGVSWMFPKIIEPWLRKELNDIELFKASIYDNPYIPREEIARLEAKYPPGSIERRIRLDGEWLPGLMGARAYSGFNRMINVREQMPPDPRRPACWFMDFNVEPMMSGIGYRSSDGVFHVWRELVLDQGDIFSMVQLFYEMLPRHGAEIWVYGDATSKGRSRQTGQSDYALIAQGMRQYGAPMRMKVPESNPAVPDRINAVNRICRDEQGAVRLEIDPACIELIADLEQVLRDGRGGLKKDYNTKSTYARRTHISDALGYWIAYEEPVRNRPISGVSKIKVPMPTYKLQVMRDTIRRGFR